MPNAHLLYLGRPSDSHVTDVDPIDVQLNGSDRYRAYHLRFNNGFELLQEWTQPMEEPEVVGNTGHNHVVVDVNILGRVKYAAWVYNGDLFLQPGTGSLSAIRSLLQRWVNRRLCNDPDRDTRIRARLARRQRRAVQRLALTVAQVCVLLRRALLARRQRRAVLRLAFTFARVRALLRRVRRVLAM
jgi:hypothetical protein